MSLHPFAPDDFPTAWQEVIATVLEPEGSRVVGGEVTYESGGVAFEGYVARDEALSGPRPAVLLVHDWTGVGPTVRARAHMLARLGYVAFAADVYGAGVRPVGDAASAEAGRYYADLPLLRSRVAAGLERLLAEPGVDPARVAAAGYCFGGSAAVELARSGADLRGVVSIHGRLVVHEPSDAAAIRASVLVLTGGADGVVPDSDVHAFADELRATEGEGADGGHAGHEQGVEWEITSYSGAPHAFTIAGTDRYREHADRRTWQAFTSFLADTLSR
jgi:dienelactone hydrolase